MGRKEDKLTKNRLRTSYITTIISISLVLFLLGNVGLLVLNAKRLSDYVKENIGFSVILKDNVKEVDVIRLQKDIDATRYVKATEFVTKEQAAKDFSAELGEDFVDFLGYNPLPISIDVHLLADYANPDSLKIIEADFLNYPQVKNVYYHKNLLHLVNRNVKKISFILLAFSVLLFLISFALINNTIRLAVYSKRFIINTMKLVGATRGFIRFPFLVSSTIQGFIGAIIAIGLLIGVIYGIQNEFEQVITLYDYKIIGALFFLVIVLGILITMVATFFAVNKYLRIKQDQLYL
ncbi:MAG TPA: cell division protein FtsX [Bacteroidales bacterium]|nr:MAG: cell division protein FtsX [Bacteroidetes bacterium GWF2_33_38]OFY75399.1 MAG: cell division protein FtsX [Bacteroidetes bacterium RIFOXYA12_FULL_33_9]OFY84972.1 MAG: cell division protein FtsX [Bacteroidetes bacterium RIFOXYA2_FULL_33_7]HBF87443.1 cell division protein FtsX [Bacteroidales bacterium]